MKKEKTTDLSVVFVTNSTELTFCHPIKTKVERNMAIISIYLAINLLFVALLFKRQRILSYLSFAELFILLFVWFFSVKFTAGFATRLVGEEAYGALNLVFTSAFGDGYLARSTLILLQVAVIIMLCYLTFHTVQYIAEKIGNKPYGARICDDYGKNYAVSSTDKRTVNKVFILHCRLNN